MSELKFTCPTCGQHMQCEKSYGGDKTVCPSCSAELRIPFSHTPPELKTQLPRAELIMKADAPATLSTVATSAIHVAANVTNDNPFARSDIPVQIESLKEPEKKKAAAPSPPVKQEPVRQEDKPEHREENKPEHVLHCVCPVCQSELSIAENAPAQSGLPPTAELVTRTPSPAQQPPAENQPHAAPAGPDPTPIVERERQIAVAREAHQVALYPAMKPRLSYVLSGEKPPPNDPAHPPADETHPPTPDVKTLNE